MVGISLPDQVYNYTNGIITDSLAIYQGSTTDAKYTAIFDAEIYETIPVTNARVQSTMTDIQSLINRYGTTVVRSSKIYEYYDTANNIMTGFVEDKLPGQAYYAYMLDNELRTGVGDFTIV